MQRPGCNEGRKNPEFQVTLWKKFVKAMPVGRRHGRVVCRGRLSRTVTKRRVSNSVVPAAPYVRTTEINDPVCVRESGSISVTETQRRGLTRGRNTSLVSRGRRGR